MAEKQKLSQLLPIQFSNRVQIKRFAKHCPQCKHTVDAGHMYGLARLVDEHVLLCATATCPKCKHVFTIQCVIDNEKNVQRVWLPHWFFKHYVGWVGEKIGESTRIPVQNKPPILPVMVDELEISTQEVGRYLDKPIYSRIRVNGIQFVFKSVATAQDVRTEQFYIFENRLLYEKLNS